MAPSDQGQPLWVQPENETLENNQIFSTTLQPWHLTKPQLRRGGHFLLPGNGGGALTRHAPVLVWGGKLEEALAPLPFAPPHRPLEPQP